MGQVVSAAAYANNEVAYVAWDVDGKIEGCLGFEVTRVYLNADGSFQYTPNPNFHGYDWFSYSVNDGRHTSWRELLERGHDGVFLGQTAGTDAFLRFDDAAIVVGVHLDELRHHLVPQLEHFPGTGASS